jgi:predicted dehydrogenase
MNRKFIVVGGGSMGKRRIRCLLAKGINPEAIRVVDVRDDRRDESNTKYQVGGFSSLEAGLEWNPDAVMVSLPGGLHMDACLPAARAGKHLFCEVPLSVSIDGLDELTELVSSQNLVFAAGCQPPFHPLYKQLKAWMADAEYGKTLSVIETFGQYLPDWHPFEDYRKFYAASQKMGGCNLDVIAQQATLMSWLLNDRIDEVFCRGNHLSTLEVDGSDCLQVLAKTAQGTALTQQYDLIQRAGHHSIRLISETTTLEYNPGESNVRRYRAKSKEWETVTVPEGYEYEQCYIDEIGLFLQCLEGQAQWHVPLSTAIGVVRFLEAILQSAKNDKIVRIES